MMAATTGGKARLFDLVATVMELVRDGERDENQVANWLQRVKDRPDFVMFNGPTAPTFKYDKTKDGWTKLEDVGPRITSLKGLKLLSFLKCGENYINGEVMKKRAEEQNASFGQLDAEWLLEHQDQIPKEFRKYYLAFPGTVWQDSSGLRSVAYLIWDGDGWCLGWNWLDHDWYSSYRLLSFGKS